ncbi:MAG: fused MFS/spermidine synthase [Pseudomonadota bacterium]
MSSRSLLFGLMALNALLLGGAIMAFEMVSSRFISPYFGSGIFAWGAIIATVLTGMSAGYIVGGLLADRLKNVGWFGVAVIAAGALVAATPGLVNLSFPYLMDNVSDVRAASLYSALLILLLPTFVLAMHSPFEIRVLLRSTATAGRTVGIMNGIATFGAILGTLGTSFFLIPSFGSRALALGIGAVVALAGLIYVAVGMTRRTADHGTEVS